MADDDTTPETEQADSGRRRSGRSGRGGRAAGETSEATGGSAALANALRERGVGSKDGMGILCRNHRGLFESLVAGAKLGTRTLLLNTDFAGPQLADVCEREDVTVLVDSSLTDATVLYTATGDSGTALGVHTQDLLRLTNARVCPLLAPAPIDLVIDLTDDLDTHSSPRAR